MWQNYDYGNYSLLVQYFVVQVVIIIYLPPFAKAGIFGGSSCIQAVNDVRLPQAWHCHHSMKCQQNFHATVSCITAD